MKFIHHLCIATSLLGLCACGPRPVNDVYASGQVKIKGELLSGKQDGYWQYFYEDGSLKSEGAWLKDYQNGPWTYYYANGKKKQAGNYNKKLRDGAWQYWYANGKTYCAGSYSADRQVGSWDYYRQDGSLFSQGNFVDGVKHGLWRWYDKQGQLANSGAFYKGQRVGPWQIDGVAVDKGLPEGFQLRQAPGRVAMLDANNDLRLALNVNQKRVTAFYADEYFMSLHTNGRTQGEITASGTKSWYDNGRLAVENGFGYLRDGSELPDIKLAADGPGKEAKDLFDLVNKLYVEIDKIPEQKAQSVAAKDELIISKQEQPALTPVVHIDSLWTKREEKKVGKLAKEYTSALPGEGDYFGETKRKMQKEWLNKPLPQTRFFTADGSVVDLNTFKGDKSVTVIVMRGFAGQVCVYCSTQTRVLSEQIEKFKSLGNEVVIVYPGPAETIPMFIKAVKSVGGDASDLNIVLDVNLNLVKSLEILKDLSKPASLITDKQGKVIYAYVGKNMGDRPSTKELLSFVKQVQ